MPKTEWIAIFKNDFVSKLFNKPGESDEVLYWIKRRENGKYHTAVSTGNTKALRSFEFYSNDLKPTLIFNDHDENEGWKCIALKETGLDNWGSSCVATIMDIKGREIDVRVHGMYRSKNRNNNGSIRDYLYPRSIIYFLSLVSDYLDWSDLELRNKLLFDDITKYGVPQHIFEKADE